METLMQADNLTLTKSVKYHRLRQCTATVLLWYLDIAVVMLTQCPHHLRYMAELRLVPDIIPSQARLLCKTSNGHMAHLSACLVMHTHIEAHLLMAIRHHQSNIHTKVLPQTTCRAIHPHLTQDHSRPLDLCLTDTASSIRVIQLHLVRTLYLKKCLARAVLNLTTHNNTLDHLLSRQNIHPINMTTAIEMLYH